MCKNAVESIIELEHFGVPFSRTEEGKIYQRPFGGMTTEYGKGIAQRIRQQLIGQAMRFCIHYIHNH